MTVALMIAMLKMVGLAIAAHGMKFVLVRKSVVMATIMISGI
jgi:hypothetical protein